MLDVLLTGQLAEDRTLAGEADLVDWWWEQQVRGSQRLTAEENVARQLAARMADELSTEVSPETVRGAEEAADNLLRKSVLRRTRDGRLSFDHDLLADWSRVMHLRSLGEDSLAFMREHTENPPWLRAIRLLSQHLLERAAELERWRAVVALCSSKTKDGKEPSAESLQVLDAWLEGIAYCGDARGVLTGLRAELFGQNGWLLKRFVRRLLHVGTLPDPIFQERFRQVDADMAELAAMQYRLPRYVLWTPILNFLIVNQEDATDYLPVEVAEIGAMWARLEEYLKLEWSALAQLILLNAEKELRREVAGEYRRDSGPRNIAGSNRLRVSIYSVALQAASRIPDRPAKLVLKAAGRAPWEEGDVSSQADRRWRGEWFHEVLDGGRLYVKSPPESWPDGPRRRVSDDFLHAWFESTASLALYRSYSDVACEATLAFIIDWPKSEMRGGHHRTGIDRHGFRFRANYIYPPFWTKGPFLVFLREKWQPALELIVKLTNFATDRYADWWPYEPGVTEVTFAAADGNVSWRGTHQVYAWHRYHMNTVVIVTCALMALEKWLSERLDSGESIADPVQLLFAKGCSLAFAGVLVSIGKRWPHLFLSELKPLLFLRDLYVFDQQAVVNESAVAGSWFRDPSIINKLRNEWNQVPGRRTSLREACYQWLIERPEFSSLFADVAAAWYQEAEALPTESEDRRVLLRWACGFDRSMWKQVILPNGQTAWQNDRPEELRDRAAEQALARRQTLLTLPMQCAERLQKRQALSDEEADHIWERLRTWDEFEIDEAPDEDNWLWDHRHAKAGLLVLLLCLAESWLRKYPERRPEIQAEVRRLLVDPPKIEAFSPDEQHDDGEGFLARCVVQCWAAKPNSEEWRAHVGQFVTAYRYCTVRTLFDEAFRLRTLLGTAYSELEALAVSWPATREKANRLSYSHHKPESTVIDKWMRKWLPAFAKRRGPKWLRSWGFPLAYEVLPGNTLDKTTLKEFLHKIEKQYGKAERIWVMDRGIPTEEVLTQMRQSDPPIYYLVGTPRGRLTQLELEQKLLGLSWKTVRPGVKVKLLPQEKELYVLAESHDRINKERAMRRRQLRLLLKRLKKLKQMKLSSTEKLLLKLGQAKGEYPRACRLIDIDMPRLATPSEAPSFSFRLNRQKLRTVRRREGRYLLRTNLCGREPAQLWQFYIQLVEIEAVFKNLKDDLKLRPINHQLENRIEAHIFVAFIAYCLQITLRARLKSLAPGLTARAVLEKFATIQMLDVKFPTTDGRTLILSRYTEPNTEQKILLEQLKLVLPPQPPPRISAKGELMH